MNGLELAMLLPVASAAGALVAYVLWRSRSERESRLYKLPKSAKYAPNSTPGIVRAELKAESLRRTQELLSMPSVSRTCPTCGNCFERHPVVVEPRCDECIVASFNRDVSEEADHWDRQGWPRQ